MNLVYNRKKVCNYDSFAELIFRQIIENNFKVADVKLDCGQNSHKAYTL